MQLHNPEELLARVAELPARLHAIHRKAVITGYVMITINLYSMERQRKKRQDVTRSVCGSSR